MNRRKPFATTTLATAIALLIGGPAAATEPCGDFGECKVLVEINASDGDIGFHFLMDGDNLRRASMFNPHHRKIFSYATRRELGDSQSVNIISDALRDPDPQVGKRAAELLDQLNDDALFHALYPPQ